MIIGNLKDAERYFGVNEHFEKAFAFLKTLSKDTPADGFEGDGFRGGIAEIEASGEVPKLEAHKAYLDIHFVISGAEKIGYADVDKLTPETEYSEADDVWFLTGEQQDFILQKICLRKYKTKELSLQT